MHKRRIATFEEAEDYINQIPRFTSKNTMEDTRAFLRRLGNPDKEMRIIHVAGTNGKGSVCAYLRGILEAAGYCTALFTSPHLVDIRERFVVRGEMVSREEFLEAFLHIYNLLDGELPETPEAGGPGGDKSGAGLSGYHPSYFEYLFFMAMVIFAGKAPDYCILETGLGGRLDATNAVSGKELSVITRIGLDHVEILGDTVTEIAWEKAGIMHPGAPAVFWDTCPETTLVFRSRAAELGILAYSVSESDYSFSNFKRKTIDFCIHTEYYNYVGLSLGTIARYQMENCALAVRAAEVLDGGRTITGEHIKQGVSGCFWAGRMEEALPGFYVDGAHNGDGVRAFLETVASDGHTGGRTLLFGVVKDKDYGRMAGELAASGLFDRIAVTGMRTGRAVAAGELAGLLEAYPGVDFRIYGNVDSAVRRLLRERREGERIYAAGSLYLVGEIKELLEDDKF